jgi:hypothetical protein
MLVGTWTATSPFPGDPAGPDRLLVIDSVTRSGSKWIVAARFSSPTVNRQPYRIDAKLEVVGHRANLSFLTAAITGPATSVELTMMNSHWLSGTFHGRQIQFQKASPRAERPTYTLGDKWIRDDGVYDLIRIEKDRYIFASAAGREIYLTKDLVVARVQKGPLFMEFFPPPQYAWPLEVGKWGTSRLTWRHAWGPDTHGARFTWKVEAYEDVYTTAGRFKAFRIVQKMAVDTGTPERELITWYAPEARQVVKMEGHPWFGFLAFQNVAVDRPPSEPLAIEVQLPKDQMTVTGSEIVLASKTTSGKGVASVIITLNGEEVRKWEWNLPSTPLKEKRLDLPVTLREGKNLLLVTAVDSEGTSRQEARTLFYEEPDQRAAAATAPPATSEPLAIDIQVPKDEMKVTGSEIVLTGKASAGKGVAGLIITLNGKEIRKWEWDLPSTPLTEKRLDLPITLKEGKNQLLVAAIDSEGTRRQEARTLFYEKPATTPPAATPIPDSGPPPSPRVPTQRPPAPAPMAPPSAVARPTPPAESQPAPVTASPVPPAASASLPPLHITVSSPPDQARVEHESVALAGLVSGGIGIRRVVVTLNGAEVSRLEERTPQSAMAVNLALKLREGQNTLVVTATAVGGTIYQEVRSVHYERLLPLSIAFRYPQDRAHVDQDSSVAAAEVTSSKGVATVSVTLNGVEVHQQRERTPQKSLLVTVPLTLREGPNVIAISATEPDGTVKREIRTVTYAQPKEMTPEPPPRPSSLPRPDRWAVVIGVGHYESPDIPKLRYSVPDAETIYAVLTGPGGFKNDHVLLLTDKTEKKPTYRNLKWALGTFLARSARKDDTVVIFFAGHGAPEVDQRGIERDGLAKYLVPSDAEPDDLYSTAFPMDELQTIFARIEADRVIAFLDSCYSGAAGGRTFSSKKTRAPHLDDLFLERLTRSKGRAILTASRPAEVSIELPELGHGIFTYFLAEGLRGAADLNRDGIVTLQEVYEYVEQQVAQKSRAVGGNQHPVMKGELEGLLPLMRVSGR